MIKSKPIEQVRMKWDKLFDYAQRYIQGANPQDVRKQRLQKYVNEFNLLSTADQKDVEVRARYYVDFKNITQPLSRHILSFLHPRQKVKPLYIIVSL